MRARRRLLTVGHSYVVPLNRRLVHEMARVGGAEWDVTAVIPESFHGDLGRISAEVAPGEPGAPRTVPVHLSRRVHLMVYGRGLASILRERWDLVHCWEEPFIVAGAQVARWNGGRAALVYATFQNLPKRYPPPFGAVERYSMERAAAWIALGHTVESTLSANPGYAARPRRVLHLGVDTAHFRPDPAARRATLHALGWDDGGAPVVGFVGRFVAEKGLELLTRALDGVRAPWRALFVGGGPLEPWLRDWARARGGEVRVVTGVPHHRVAMHLNVMDVMCAPSQTTPRWREQFGRMLVEAFACGVPVIASDSGEIPWVVGDAGVLVGEAHEAGWTAAIADLLHSPARRLELAARGVERARDAYAWPTVARAHLDFFGELLDSGSRP